MIQLVAGFWVDPWAITCVKEINDSSCLVYLTGEGAMDGHVLPYNADEVVDAIIEARNGEDEEEPSEGEQE